ncbi:MAG TPA: TIGR02117 family protein [Croceibacterium sp.]|nr:TIGR02117 family protein [Croceibacterium sp.]
MAAPARCLKLAARVAGGALAGVVAVVLAFALVSWAGSSIPRNPGWRQPAPENPGVVEIMVGSNGIHTEIVMPLVTPEQDWRPVFPVADLPVPDRGFTHVAVSWGEREVFLETPTWWDLRPVTVLRVIGIGGEGLIHASHYVRPAPSEDFRPLRLTAAQYRRLVAAVVRSLPPGARVRHDGYGPEDVFYEAPGRYTVTRTCNQWTSDTLAAAGVRIGWWTPFAGGVMKWIPRPEA